MRTQHEAYVLMQGVIGAHSLSKACSSGMAAFRVPRLFFAGNTPQHLLSCTRLNRCRCIRAVRCDAGPVAAWWFSPYLLNCVCMWCLSLFGCVKDSEPCAFSVSGLNSCICHLNMSHLQLVYKRDQLSIHDHCMIEYILTFDSRQNSVNQNLAAQNA